MDRYLTVNRVYNSEGEIHGNTKVCIDLELVVCHEEFYDDTLKVKRPYTTIHLDTTYFLDAFMMIDIDFDRFNEMFLEYRKKADEEAKYLYRRN
jgi:hypothetical protein